MAYQTLTYLKSRFEKGDYPDQNDFNDLLDSCFNYSLSDSPEYITFLKTASANWELAYTVLDQKRYIWDEAYAISSQYRSVSSTFATQSHVSSNYLRLSGGTLTSSVNVLGPILSGGVNLFSLFLNPLNGYQNLSYNDSDYIVNISSGNYISLSSLRTTLEIPFTHSSYTPLNNRLYIYGQLNTPPTTAINLSNCYRSFYRGLIKEATINNDFTSGSTETSTLFLVNRTQNLTATLISDLRYTDALAEETTNLTNTLKNGIPTNWSATAGVTFNAQGADFSDSNQILTTALLSNSTKYQKLSVFAIGFADGTSPASVKLLYSQNNSNYVLVSTRVANLLSDTLLNFGEFVVPGGLSNTFTLRLETNQPVVIHSFNVVGYFPTDTRLRYISLASPLSVFPGDLLDIRQRTNSYLNNPTNVVNLINARLDII